MCKAFLISTGLFTYSLIASPLNAGIKPIMSPCSMRIMQSAIQEGLLKAPLKQRLQRRYCLNKDILLPPIGDYARLLRVCATEGLANLSNMHQCIATHSAAFGSHLNKNQDLTAVYQRNLSHSPAMLSPEQRVGNWLQYMHIARAGLFSMQQELIPKLTISHAVQQVELCKQFESLALDNQTVTIFEPETLKIIGTIGAYCTVIDVIHAHDPEAFKVIFNGY